MVKELSELTLEELWQLFPIVLKEYNPEYPRWYQIEAENLIELLGASAIVRINHIGSTAVEELVSKPTIDILLEIHEHCEIKQITNKLVDAGWILMSHKNAPYLDYVFNKGYTKYGFAEKVYHLHVRNSGSWDELYFRDYLKENFTIAKEYGALKLKLIDVYKENRDGYTMAKTDFIKKYTTMARPRYAARYEAE